jgi:hypothetical protein
MMKRALLSAAKVIRVVFDDILNDGFFSIITSFETLHGDGNLAFMYFGGLDLNMIE